VVVLADSLYFAGRTIVVDHGHGLFTTYSHLSQVSVLTGEPVRKGQLIGQVGATGRVTGPHLHWAVHLAGARVDPLSLMWASRGVTEAEPTPLEAKSELAD
jgi:murein DD-endopeptidase MepM/ murein hydrolase activator NlpD